MDVFDPAIVLSMCKLLLIVFDSRWYFGVEENLYSFWYRLFIYKLSFERRGLGSHYQV